MFRYSVLFGVLIGFFLGSVVGCNKQCRDKEGSATRGFLFCDDQIINDVVSTINEVCKQISAQGTASSCNHTASLPSGIFSERPTNLTLKYTDIKLDSKDYELDQSKGEFNASVSFSYSNLTLTVDDSYSTIIISVDDNNFKVVFSSKITSDNSPNQDCFFEWNRIQVDRFSFSTTILGHIDQSRHIVEKFQKDNLQSILNSKPLMDYLNKETSACNIHSFLNNVTGIFFSKLILEGIESFVAHMYKT